MNSRISEQLPIIRAVTKPPQHHFFGYYDKCPWDWSGRYILALETGFIDRPPGPDDTATIGLVDLEANNNWQPISKTRAWNWQQGTMLQWLETVSDKAIIYNDRKDGQFVSVIQDIESGKRRFLPRPIYALSHNGKSALSLNFARLHQTRPGYGYAGISDPWEDELCPEEDGIYWMDLNTGENRLIISLKQIVKINHRPTMDNVKHWFNHLLFSPDDQRFIFLHRWHTKDGKGRWTRMFTARPDGSDIYCIADDEMVSHFDWYNSNQILAWARQKEIGDRYFLFTDQTDKKEIVGEGILTQDGHSSYSPDRRWILTDTYAGKKNRRTLILYSCVDSHRINIGHFFSPPELKGEIRCDLHPRWSRDGQEVCIDSAHEGHRQMYILDVASIVQKKGL